MKALRSRVALKRKYETAIIQSPVRESKSNGAMESSIMSWKGLYRTLRLYLEHRIKAQVSFGHPLLRWLSVWSAEVINNCRPHNGRTSYELMTGHRVKHLLVAFGEKVMVQFTADKSVRNDFEILWIPAYSFGVETSSGSYLVANSSGVFEISSLRLGPSESPFDAAILSDVKLSHSHFISKGASTSLRAPSVVRRRQHA